MSRRYARKIMLTLIDRETMIEDLAAWFGTGTRIWRGMDQGALDTAWLLIRTR